MRTITVQEFHAEIKAQGVPLHQVAVVCPMCGTIQCAADLIAAGAGATFDDVEKYLGFSCVGRWRGFSGDAFHLPESARGKGCNWTLGGLFKFHKLEVVTQDGAHHPRFELATPEQAKKLACVREAA